MSKSSQENTDVVASWGIDKLIRWYERGKQKVDRELRIETLINKVINLDVYVKEMMELNLNAMGRI